jgi:hypothetical protein
MQADHLVNRQSMYVCDLLEIRSTGSTVDDGNFVESPRP